MPLYYLDTSALVKLVVQEAETAALVAFIANHDPADFVTSALTRAELLRATNRRGGAQVEHARLVMQAVGELTLTESVLDEAGMLQPTTLRTLDAIHLATARELGSDLTAFVAYDHRLLQAAQQVGIATVAPR